MAISNLGYPSGSPSVQDTLWHVFNSSASGQTTLKYILDILIDNVQQVRVKLYPEPSNGRGYFDAGPIVRNTMTYEWLTPSDDVLMCEPVSGQIAQSYVYQIGEEVSGVSTYNLASGTVTAYNWTAPLFKRKVSDISTYNGKAFTNRPNKITASLTDNIYMGCKDVSGITVSTYDGTNTLIATTAFSFGSSKAFGQLNIGAPALNNPTTIITSACKYYTVTIGTSVITVTMECNPKYTSYNLHFMNHLGVFDTARFGLASRLTMDVSRKGFEKRDYSLGASSVSYYDANNKYVSSKINYLNKSDHAYKLTMDAPTDEDYNWLNELIDSPQIYFEQDGYFYPVSLKNSNYEYSKYVNNRLRVFEVDINLDQTRYSQLR